MGTNSETLFDTFTVKGYWWIKGKKKSKAVGELCFSAYEIRLDLEGSLLSGQANPLEMDEENRVILGEDATGKRYTLIGAIQTKLRGPLWKGMSGYPQCRYTARVLVKGEHFQNIDTPVSNGAYVWFHGLFESLAKTGISVKNWNLRNVACSWRSPKSSKLKVQNSDCKIRPSFYCEGSLNADGLSLRDAVNLDLEFSRKMTIQEVLDLVYSLRNLLTLLHCSPCPIERVNLKAPDAGNIGLFFRQRVESHERISSIDEILVPFKELHWRTREKVVNSWFEQSDEFYIAVQAFSRTVLYPSDFHRLDYLELCQAIESFHRVVYGGTYIDQDDYQNTVASVLTEAIPQTVSSAHRSKLKAMIKYGYEYSLRKRLQDLLDRLSDPVRTKLVRRKNQFVSRIVDTRNYLTHLSKDPGSAAMDEKGIVFSNMGLKLLLAAAILEYLGVPGGLLAKRMQGTRLYRSLVFEYPW